MICIGLEGTAEKTGVGIVDSDGTILASKGKALIPGKGGIHPREAAEHHAKNLVHLIKQSLKESGLTIEDVDLVAFSRGPGLGPALRTVATAARSLALLLKVPLIGVNHCIGHIEIGRLTTCCQDPLTLYVSGGNTQVIAFDAGRYQVFGETLDIAIGNCLDQFARRVGLGHPGGPRIEELAWKSDNYLKLPYTVKGMDLSFSGLLTAAIRQFESGATLEDVCFSLQETAFSMLVEVTERALAHSKKSEVLLVGGVAANKRLREMLDIMTQDHYADFFMPEMKYCGDNGAMIAWLGMLMHQHGIKQNISNSKVIQRYRTDEVDLPWMEKSSQKLQLPPEMIAKGAEANIYADQYLGEDVLSKKRISKSYRIKEIDLYLRKKRTRKEVKLLGESKRCGIITPLVYHVDEEKTTIIMENVKGSNVKELFSEETKLDISQIRAISNNIGVNIARLHNCGIIHGDLTTSNIILRNNENYQEADVVFIDFGLGKNSNLVEDKGVDLLVFKKAISSIHHDISQDCFISILNGYQEADDYKQIVAKIEEIERRGRYTS
ncbi:MAG: bifunctional N(6)-L-threonylcarbamoyladenine synthase/serine/threonine protein kinase [Methanobacterium sp.]|nr:bifunctional N(6)-L-threonylcarbamoyladenine synthase/serine/threonine protein kinase [Methanobacterium sp.]